MQVVDLFAGTGSATQPFEDRGHRVYKVELDDQHDADLYADVNDVTVDDLPDDVDFVWASPPCTTFSVASISTHWTGGRRAYIPATQRAKDAIILVRRTISLIEDTNPKFWVMENPRGVLRKLPVVDGLDRVTVTYCQYGDDRMKPTDLWGKFPPSWTPRPMCKNGQPCHVAAPRGSATGTQGRSLVDRSRVPYALGDSIVKAVEADI